MFHDAKILLIFMQKYGKTLKHGRIFPIFYNFAVKINNAMKYFEVNFTISAPLEHLHDVRDVLAALVGEAGFETFEETPEGMKGYVQRDAFDKDVLDGAIDALPFPNAHVSYEISDAPDLDWNEQWEQEGFEPISVGEHLIIYDGRHLPKDDQSDRLLVEIDAHLAFGTGNHATTRMMAQALMQMKLDGCAVLDCGTGTGVLAIIALKRGAVEAIGYDIDEWSVDNARHNAVINRVDHCFTSILGDSIVIEQTGKQFDVVLANINRNILLADMPMMCRAMKKDAFLLLSGFYVNDTDILKAKAQEQGLSLAAEQHDGEWACLIFKNQH